ncbi:MAG: heme-copper oxidase subunit III [Myxococcota bacterium]|nr:heme-copper oxidase subunit III [Myxococcota bacterium]
MGAGNPLQPVGDDKRIPMMPHGLFGMLIFVVAEIMFFAGMISAFLIIKAVSPVWPPLDQPRLPVEETAINTLALLASGFFLILAHRAFHRGDREKMRRPLWIALFLGAFFVLFQGAEWVALLGQGLTLTSSSLGSFFYLIVGVHALHAVAALVLLGVAAMRLRRGWLTPGLFGAAETLWFFVVAVWPVLYIVVYL